MSSDTILILLSLAAATAWLTYLVYYTSGNLTTSSVKVDVKLDGKQPEWSYESTSPVRNKNNESI